MDASQKERPDVAIFPDLNMVIRTPAGREYRGKVLEHPSQHAAGETWLQVQFLDGVGKDDIHGRPAQAALPQIRPARIFPARVQGRAA